MNKKYLFFVNTNAIHNVPESGYNQIDVAYIVFIFVCESMCVILLLIITFHCHNSWIIG